MDQRATELTDETEKPENQENDKDSPEHMFSFGLVSFASCAMPRVRLKFFKIRAALSEGAVQVGREANKKLAGFGRND
jgi:hypothetical protein